MARPLTRGEVVLRPLSLLLCLLVCASTARADSGDPDATRFFAGWQLPSADGLYERWDPRRSWGASHVVAALQEVAHRVAFELPLADPLMIGDISRRGGGRMPGHRTHDKGIDVDVGLYMTDQRQPLGGFLDLRPHQLDVHANWVLITALLDTGQVQHVLLDQGHIDRLRRYALDEVGLDEASVDRIFPPRGTRIRWQETGVVRHAPNHRSHLHVRLAPPSDALDEELPVVPLRGRLGPEAGVTSSQQQ